MKFKLTVPYVIAAAGLIGLSTANGMGHRDIGNISWNKIHIHNAYAFSQTAADAMATEQFLEQKADSLCGHYVNRMLNAQHRLAPFIGTAQYKNAVTQELPGAPVGMHCVYGQYTHLTRAIHEMGDTLNIIPDAGNRSCNAFRATMQKKYSGPQYAGCIHAGVMYASDSAYNAALGKYLAARRITDTSPDRLRIAATREFAKNHFSIDKLNPGAILLVPRHRGSRTKFHAIMYPGRGHIGANGQFVADSNGDALYSAHNKERLGDLFDTWDTSNVFAVDTKKNAQVEYAAELQRIETLDTPNLIAYIAPKTQADRDALATMTRHELQQWVRKKYFNRGTPMRIPHHPVLPDVQPDILTHALPASTPPMLATINRGDHVR